MPAGDSSSSKPEAAAITITARISLDGVLLDCSEEEVSSLSELAGLPFDRLILTLTPCLVGSETPPKSLSQSHRLRLIDHQEVDGGLRLTYQRLNS